MIIRNDCNKEIGPLRFEYKGLCINPTELFINDERIFNILNDLVNRVEKVERSCCVVKIPKSCSYQVYTFSDRQTKKICCVSDIKLRPSGEWKPLGFGGWYVKEANYGRRYFSQLVKNPYQKFTGGGYITLSEKEFFSIYPGILLNYSDLIKKDFWSWYNLLTNKNTGLKPSISQVKMGTPDGYIDPYSVGDKKVYVTGSGIFSESEFVKKRIV